MVPCLKATGGRPGLPPGRGRELRLRKGKGWIRGAGSIGMLLALHGSAGVKGAASSRCSEADETRDSEPDPASDRVKYMAELRRASPGLLNWGLGGGERCKSVCGTRAGGLAPSGGTMCTPAACGVGWAGGRGRGWGRRESPRGRWRRCGPRARPHRFRTRAAASQLRERPAAPSAGSPAPASEGGCCPRPAPGRRWRPSPPRPPPPQSRWTHPHPPAAAAASRGWTPPVAAAGARAPSLQGGAQCGRIAAGR